VPALDEPAPVVPVVDPELLPPLRLSVLDPEPLLDDPEPVLDDPEPLFDDEPLLADPEPVLEDPAPLPVRLSVLDEPAPLDIIAFARI